MKKNILWLFVALFALVCSTPLLSSCSKDKDAKCWEIGFFNDKALDVVFIKKDGKVSYTIIPTRFTAASTTFCGCCCFINEKESSYQGLRVSVGPAPFSAFIRTDATILESKTVYL